MYHSRRNNSNWSLANWGSILLNAIMWNAKSHVAYWNRGWLKLAIANDSFVQEVYSVAFGFVKRDYLVRKCMFGIVLILIESSKSQTRSHRLWPIRTKPINTMNQSEHKVKKKKTWNHAGKTRVRQGMLFWYCSWFVKNLISNLPYNFPCKSAL